MTRDEALDVLQRNLATTREALDVLRETHPMGVVESEAQRATGSGDLETPSGGDRAASAAPPSLAPRCGVMGESVSTIGHRVIIGDTSGWEPHECERPAGHDGLCRCRCGVLL